MDNTGVDQSKRICKPIKENIQLTLEFPRSGSVEIVGSKLTPQYLSVTTTKLNKIFIIDLD